MKFGLSADIYEDAKISNLISELSDWLPQYFESINYGNSDVEFFIVIVCVPHDFKQRKRFDKSDNVLYWDVMVDYKATKNANAIQKKAILAKAIVESLKIIDKYKQLGIDVVKIKEDMLLLFQNMKWCNK